MRFSYPGLRQPFSTNVLKLTPRIRLIAGQNPASFFERACFPRRVVEPLDYRVKPKYRHLFSRSSVSGPGRPRRLEELMQSRPMEVGYIEQPFRPRRPLWICHASDPAVPLSDIEQIRSECGALFFGFRKSFIHTSQRTVQNPAFTKDWTVSTNRSSADCNLSVRDTFSRSCRACARSRSRCRTTSTVPMTLCSRPF